MNGSGRDDWQTNLTGQGKKSCFFERSTRGCSLWSDLAPGVFSVYRICFRNIIFTTEIFFLTPLLSLYSKWLLIHGDVTETKHSLFPSQ